jgi:hypothetical protein
LRLSQSALRLLKHDPQKWIPVFGKIMLKQQVKAKQRIT